jgi:hypothetical protein
MGHPGGFDWSRLQRSPQPQVLNPQLSACAFIPFNHQHATLTLAGGRLVVHAIISTILDCQIFCQAKSYRAIRFRILLLASCRISLFKFGDPRDIWC